MASVRKPNAAYIAELVKYVQQEYREHNDNVQALRLRRFQKVAPKIPEEFRKTAAEFRAPLVADFVRKAKAVSADKMPVPTVIPNGVGPRAQENSSLREEWLNAAYLRMEEDNPAFEMFWDAVVGDGLGIIKLLSERYRWGDALGGEPTQEDAERYQGSKRAIFPFRWEHVDTLTYYPIYDEDGLAEVLVITRRQTLPLARKWGLVPTGDGKLRQDRRIGQVTTQEYPPTVLFTEYWSRTHFSYQVDDVQVKVEEHGWGRPPFYMAAASITSSKDPAEQFQSLAAPLVQIQDAIDNMETMALNRAYLTAFPYTTLDQISEDFLSTEQLPKEIKLKHSEVNFVAGARFRWMEPPPLSADVQAMQNFLLAMGDRMSLAPILSGIMNADASGVTTTTMIAVAKAIFGPGLRAVARVFDQMAADMQRHIDQVIGEPVPVFALSTGSGKWLELGPKEIDGYYRVIHENEPVIAAEQRLEYITLADALARGLVDQAYVLEKGLGIHNPEDMLKRVKIEQLTKMPQYLNLMMQAVVEALRPGENAAPMGTPATPPIGMGGPGAPQQAGIQQPMIPQGPMAAREERI